MTGLGIIFALILCPWVYASWEGIKAGRITFEDRTAQVVTILLTLAAVGCGVAGAILEFV